MTGSSGLTPQEQFAVLAQRLRDGKSPDEVQQIVVDSAVDLVPGCDRAAIGVLDGATFHSATHTPRGASRSQRESAWSMMGAWPLPGRAAMSTEDLEKYETEMELQLYREYRDIVRQFTYVVETERRFYLANSVDLQVREAGGEVYFELKLSDAWVWDMYRPARFVRNVRVLTFKDVNVEELDKPDLELPDTPR